MDIKYLKSVVSYNPETGVFTLLVDSVRKKAGECAESVGPSGAMQLCFPGQSKFQNLGARYSHRMAWLYMTGEFPKGFIDHIDGNPRNNRWNNLRDVDNQTNLRNCKRRSNNKSGIAGVSLHKSGKWKAVVLNRYLGLFDDLEDAAIAVEQERRKVGGFTVRHGIG